MRWSMLGRAEKDQGLARYGPAGAGEMTGLLAAVILANLADLATFLRVKPALIAANETSPLPHLLGQTGGAVAAKVILAAVVVVTVVAFRQRPRTKAALLVIYTVMAAVGAASNALVGG
jgi:hypothetical protein